MIQAPAGLPADRVHFVSDLHFCHRRIVELSHRPFASVEAMHAALVRSWNDQVALTDWVFVLGDFSLGSTRRTREFVEQLNGQKFLVRGNHDHFAPAGLFEWTKDLYTVKVYDPSAPRADAKGLQRIVLCHFPLLVWDRRHLGAWHLHGHSHGSLVASSDALRMDVGVDPTAARVGRYRPISYAEVKAEMEKHFAYPCSYPVDHHAEDDYNPIAPR